MISNKAFKAIATRLESTMFFDEVGHVDPGYRFVTHSDLDASPDTYQETSSGYRLYNGQLASWYIHEDSGAVAVLRPVVNESSGEGSMVEIAWELPDARLPWRLYRKRMFNGFGIPVSEQKKLTLMFARSPRADGTNIDRAAILLGRRGFNRTLKFQTSYKDTFDLTHFIFHHRACEVARKYHSGELFDEKDFYRHIADTVSSLLEN